MVYFNDFHLQFEFPEIDPDTIAYGDLMAGLLEFINAILTHTLKSNAQFIYALLHRKDMFEPYRDHPRFSMLIDNITAVRRARQFPLNLFFVLHVLVAGTWLLPHQTVGSGSEDTVGGRRAAGNRAGDENVATGENTGLKL